MLFLLAMALGAPTRAFQPTPATGFDGPPLPVLEAYLAHMRITAKVAEADGSPVELSELPEDAMVFGMGLLASAPDGPLEQRLYLDGRVFQIVAGPGVFKVTRHPPVPLRAAPPESPFPEAAGRLEGFDVPEERAQVAWIRSLLSEEERLLIEPIVHVRIKEGSSADLSGASASLLPTEPYATVTYFDLGLQWVREGFAPSVVGPVDAPLPATVRNLVHELGHHLALAGTVRSLRRHQTLRGRERRHSRRCLSTLSADVLAHPGFSSLPRSGDLTVYGRTSAGEAFADAFALYRLEPETLRLQSPEVFAWFEVGAHLSAPEPCPPLPRD